MASRFPCPHETWANQRAAAAKARETRNEPLVMGATPNCPWCSQKSGQQMAETLMKAIFVDSLQKALKESLDKHCVQIKLRDEILKEMKTHAELLLLKDENADAGSGQETS